MSIIEKIKKHTQAQGECIVWTGACNHGHPKVWHDGKQQAVRRALWTEMHGPITRDILVSVKCETELCVSEKCLCTYDRLEVSLKNWAKAIPALAVKKELARRKSRAKPIEVIGVAKHINRHKAKREAFGIWAGL